MLIHVLCEVAIAGQLRTSFLFHYMGCCEDYLTCDIAYNAVMPLSHAPTRGRYSRNHGRYKLVIRAFPDFRSPLLD